MHSIKSEKDISAAEIMINEFVLSTSTLYGDDTLTFNLHRLRHLTQDVKNHGSLSYHSLFAPESFLGYFKRKIHGTRGLNTQYVKGNFFFVKYLKKIFRLNLNYFFRDFKKGFIYSRV